MTQLAERVWTIEQINAEKRAFKRHPQDERIAFVGYDELKMGLTSDDETK